MHFVQGEDSHYVLYRVRCAGRASSSQEQQQPQQCHFPGRLGLYSYKRICDLTMGSQCECRTMRVNHPRFFGRVCSFHIFVTLVSAPAQVWF